MTCPAVNPTLPASTCPTRVLSIMDSAELAACRACPRGQFLMETLRHCMPERLFTNLPPLTGAAQAGKNATKETAMPEESKIYTISELAALVGVQSSDINNARHRKDATPKPGCKPYLIREYMRTHGILWEDVMPGKQGVQTSRGKDAAESPLIRVARDMEPEDAPGEDDLPIVPPADVFTPRRPQYTLDFDLRHIPMEALVSEISRRMPGVRVSFG